MGRRSGAVWPQFPERTLAMLVCMLVRKAKKDMPWLLQSVDLNNRSRSLLVGERITKNGGKKPASFVITGYHFVVNHS